MTADPDAVPAPSLPEPVRRAVAALAAHVLGVIPEAAVPASLRRVREFAPARRARSGGGPLAAALERDAPFRQVVATAWRELHPDLAEAVDAGRTLPAADPIEVAAGIYLLRPDGWQARLADAVDAVAGGQAEARRREQEADSRTRLEALLGEVERWRADAEQARAALAALEEELTSVRREQRRLRADTDRLRAAAREAERAVEAEQSAAAEAVTAQRGALRAAEDRARRAEEDARLARRAAREGRSLAAARIRLLLDTVVEAASGLRRELAIPPAEMLPADAVAAGAAGGHDAPSRARALPPDDPGALDELLLLPRCHLVVDGYNVTKSGFGSLPLADQRRRLVDGLGAVAARTGAEITCCFDGAEVDSRQASLIRGVRVLFSDPGVTADDLIRRIVQAEPQGRPLVVVSSDAEVATAARAAAAHAVPSTALLRLLARG